MNLLHGGHELTVVREPIGQLYNVIHYNVNHKLSKSITVARGIGHRTQAQDHYRGLFFLSMAPDWAASSHRIRQHQSSADVSPSLV
jgi:hypothetical protein